MELKTITKEKTKEWIPLHFEKHNIALSECWIEKIMVTPDGEFYETLEIDGSFRCIKLSPEKAKKIRLIT
jgi:hypothetical protein